MHDNVKLFPQELWLCETVIANSLLCMESAGAKSQASSISAAPTLPWMAMCCHCRKVFFPFLSAVFRAAFLVFSCSRFLLLLFLVFLRMEGRSTHNSKKKRIFHILLIRFYSSTAHISFNASERRGQHFDSVASFARLLRTHSLTHTPTHLQIVV